MSAARCLVAAALLLAALCAEAAAKGSHPMSHGSRNCQSRAHC